MDVYSWVYVSIVLIYFAIFFFEKFFPKKDKLFNILCFLIFFFFFGFRGYIGSDWYNYQYEYLNFFWSFDFGFSLVMKFFIELGFSYLQFVTVLTLLQLIILNLGIKRYVNNVSLVYILLISLFPIVIIDLLRNYTSILIVLFGFRFLLKGSTTKYIVTIVIATLFHLTSLFFLILLLCYKKKFSSKFVTIFFIVGLIVYFFQIDFFKSSLELIFINFQGDIGNLVVGSIGKTDYAYGITFGIIEKIVLFIIVLMNVDKLKKTPVLFINMFYIYIFIYLFFSTSQVFINRFSLLFMFGYIIVIINSLEMIYTGYKKHMFYIFFIILVFLKTYLSYNNILYDYNNYYLDSEDEFTRELNRNYYYR